MRDILFKTCTFIMAVFLVYLPLSGQENSKNIVTYEDYIKRIEETLPEIKSNKTDVLLAENDINQVPVIQDNNVVGILGRDNIINFINVRNELSRS